MKITKKQLKKMILECLEESYRHLESNSIEDTKLDFEEKITVPSDEELAMFIRKNLHTIAICLPTPNSPNKDYRCDEDETISRKYRPNPFVGFGVTYPEEISFNFHKKCFVKFHRNGMETLSEPWSELSQKDKLKLTNLMEMMFEPRFWTKVSTNESYRHLESNSIEDTKSHFSQETVEEMKKLKDEKALEWKWRNRATPPEEDRKFRNNVNKWMRIKYGNTDREAEIQLITDFYKKFLQANNGIIRLTPERIQKDYLRMIESVKKCTYAALYNIVGQGFFDYMSWRIENDLVY